MDNNYIKKRAEAARWIEENKNNPSWWRPAVLTSQNTAPNSLILSDPVATQIWTDFVHQNFFVEAPEKVNGLTVYTFNPGREKEWHDVMYPPNAFEKFWRSYKNSLSTLFMSAVTAFITIILTNYFSSDSFKTEISKKDQQIIKLSLSIESLWQVNSTIKAQIDSLKAEINNNMIKKK